MFNRSLRLIPHSVRLLTRELSVFDSHNSLYKRFNEKNYSSFKLVRNADLKVSLNTRSYAKSRDIKKDKKKQIKLDESELQEYFEYEKLLTDLEKPVEYFKEELVKHATLRTSSNAIQSVKINFEGDTYTIADLAEIGKKGAKLYVLDFASFPGVIPTVVSTLQNLEMNLNVQQDGTKVFVPIPIVTKEHREILAKKSKLFFNKCKDSVRNVQTSYKKKLGTIEKVPEDVKFRIIDQLGALGDKKIHLAEEILKEKLNELLKEQ